MGKWIDVTPEKWYFNDVEEIMGITVNDVPLYSSIKYNAFVENKHALDYEFVTTVDKLIEFRLDTVVYPNENNPLIVYVNGLVVACDEIKPNTPEGKTYIKLRRPVSIGSSVRVLYAGEPKFNVMCSDLAGVSIMDTPSLEGNVVRTLGFHETIDYIGDSNNFYQTADGFVYKDHRVRVVPAGISCPICGPVQYPSALLVLDDGYSYLYDPFQGYSSEVVKHLGRQLKRVDSTDQFIHGNEYTINEGRIIVPYELNNEVLEVSILERNNQGIIKTNFKRLRPTSNSIVYNNRFFPDIYTTRAEFFTVMNLLRIAMTYKFTDSEPWRSTKTTSRFTDVQAMLNTGTPWWWENIRDIEEMKLSDGSYLIVGRGDGTLGIEHNITRAEMVVIIDKFRQWLIETFK